MTERLKVVFRKSEVLVGNAFGECILRVGDEDMVEITYGEESTAESLVRMLDVFAKDHTGVPNVEGYPAQPEYGSIRNMISDTNLLPHIAPQRKT